MAKPTKDQLLAEAKELELDVPEDATNAQIQSLIDEHKAASPSEDGDGSDSSDESDSQETPKKAKPAKNDEAQARRDAHYAEDGVTEEHERLGAQFGQPESQED